MAVERAAGGTSLIDVLDRVLDKGIVIDAWVRVSLVGIDLITVEARVVVASIDTYLKYSEAVGQVAPVSRPAAELPSHQDVVAENAALRAELAASKSASKVRRAAQAPPPPFQPRANPSVARVAAPVAPVHGVESDAKLAFVEFLLTSIDVQESARRAVDWLVGARAGHARPPCSSPKGISNEMLLVAEHGISSGAIMDFALNREDASHPLIQALDSAEPVYIDGARRRTIASRSKRVRFTPSRCAPKPPSRATACCSSPALGPQHRLAKRCGSGARSASRSRGCSAASSSPRRGSARSGCCSTASSTPSPTRSC